MNKDLFKSSDNASSNTKNSSGGKAYSMTAEGSLAKYAATGFFADTYNSSAEEQLDRVREMCKECSPEFLAKLAVYARINSKTKDMPAFILAYLARNNMELCAKAFPKVINDGKMLRNFVQTLRSGTIGSRSLGTAPKRLVQKYLESLTDEQLFRANIGNAPSLTDIVKMVHPKPSSKSREALYAYLLGKEPKKSEDKKDEDNLLPLIRQFESFKKDNSTDIPNVPFQMLTALSLTEDNWKSIARNATFNQTLKNLNTFARHNVLNDPAMVDIIADKLVNKKSIHGSGVMPYQLLMAFLHVENMPVKITNALQEAMEIATSNVPEFDGNIRIGLDVSGSMSHKVTGQRGTATSKARYIDVAALFAASILRKNKEARVIPFDTDVRLMDINPHDSIMTNAQKLSIRGGGTDCSIPARFCNKINDKVDMLIIISDNESWRQIKNYRGTGMMDEWKILKKNNPNCKLVNLDISPSDTSQTKPSEDVLMVSGFSDSVFDVISGFAREGQKYMNEDYWHKTINSIQL